jgi:hypothetical protein
VERAAHNDMNGGILASAFRLITPGDAAKDTGLAALGFLPFALSPQAQIALALGLLQLAAVVVFRLVELRHKMRMDERRLQLEIENSRAPWPPGAGRKSE